MCGFVFFLPRGDSFSVLCYFYWSEGVWHRDGAQVGARESSGFIPTSRSWQERRSRSPPASRVKSSSRWLKLSCCCSRDVSGDTITPLWRRRRLRCPASGGGNPRSSYSTAEPKQKQPNTRKTKEIYCSVSSSNIYIQRKKVLTDTNQMPKLFHSNPFSITRSGGKTRKRRVSQRECVVFFLFFFFYWHALTKAESLTWLQLLQSGTEWHSSSCRRS